MKKWLAHGTCNEKTPCKESVFSFLNRQCFNFRLCQKFFSNMQPFYRVQTLLELSQYLSSFSSFFPLFLPLTPPYHSPPFSPAAASASQLSKPQFSYKISGFHWKVDLILHELELKKKVRRSNIKFLKQASDLPKFKFTLI